MILVWSQCYITHNGGDTWFNGDMYSATGQEPKPGCAWVCNGLVVTTTRHHYIDPFQANRHYIAYTDIGLARSTDGGKTWQRLARTGCTTGKKRVRRRTKVPA